MLQLPHGRPRERRRGGSGLPLQDDGVTVRPGAPVSRRQEDVERRSRGRVGQVHASLERQRRGLRDDRGHGALLRPVAPGAEAPVVPTVVGHCAHREQQDQQPQHQDACGHPE